MARGGVLLLAASAAASAQMLGEDGGVVLNATNGARLDPDRILCPVLAALYNDGTLATDESGVAEREDIRVALHEGAGVSKDFAAFQSTGIADYTEAHKADQTFRDRCMPGFTWEGANCAAKRHILGRRTPDMLRYLNVFDMDGLETVEHGVSTGVRGGNCNGLHDPCRGKYPCQPLFEKFFAAHANRDGRVYKQEIGHIICHAAAEGDRGGEFSHYASSRMRLWQIKLAMMGWLTGFGRADEEGELYLMVEDMRRMMMEGRLPEGWKPRPWGCVTETFGGCPTLPNGQRDKTILEHVKMELPCDEEAVWWSGTTLATGESCKADGDCGAGGHASCLSGLCVCGKGRNGRQMTFAEGACREQEGVRTYAGRPCRFVRANNPDSPWTWTSPAPNASVLLV